MNDMRAVIIPKSDQLNADSLLGGPITITVSEVGIRPGTEQPVSIHFQGDDGKPWKPCKSMCRVMVACWGPDANAYVGRSLTLFCDPKVKWGGMAVGGIRISHMTGLNEAKALVLTETKGSKKPFVVQPLEVKKPTPKRTVADYIQERLNACITADEIADLLAVDELFKKNADKDTVKVMLSDAYQRVRRTEATNRDSTENDEEAA